MKRQAPNSAMPLFAGLLMSLVFLAGATAFELGNRSFEPRNSDNPVAPDADLASNAGVLYAPDTIPSELPAADLRPVIALVIDDAGVNPALTRRAIDVGIPLTVSFLPYAPQTTALAEVARASGHDIFLHMPMEPYGLEDPGPGALNRHLPPTELASRVEIALASVPGAIGLNNHMGSAFTSDARAMRAALEPLRGQGLIFLDSLTSGRSRAAATAEAIGLTTLRRSVFIDHEAGQVEDMLDQLVALARREGHAIAIGHPRDDTLASLEAWLARGGHSDVRFVTITDYLAHTRAEPVLAQASGEMVGLFGGSE
jgi:polysaccharide deacetylase 2 family uncharacterized protein YibQ